jgi:hypothetical protein
MAAPPIIRATLWAAAGFNFLAGAALAWPHSAAGALAGLPGDVPRAYALTLGLLVGLCGAMYAWLAARPRLERPWLAFLASGKCGVFLLVLVLWLEAQASGRALCLSVVDAGLGVTWLAWLLGTRKTPNDGRGAVPSRAATHARPSTGRLHSELIRGLISRGVVPARAELEARLACSAEELDRSFDELAREHGVLLHPASREPWFVHPFALASTHFVVECGSRKWWASCAWCALGVAVLARERCVVTTSLGAEGRRVQFTVQDGRLDHDDLLVHFPVPMARAWENVVYTCSTMLCFGSPAEVEDWSRRHGIPRGDVQPLRVVLELAKRWYGDYAREDWTKKSVAEARAIFSELGLTHAVWSLPQQAGRF